VCSAWASFLAIVASASERATKPRPRIDRPAMTMRLTSNAEPRSRRENSFRRVLRFVIASPHQSHELGFAVDVACPTRLHDFVAVGSEAIRYFRQIFSSGVAVRSWSTG